MDRLDAALSISLARRRLLQAVGAGTASFTMPAFAAETADLHLPGGPSARQLTAAFPEKGKMILHRSRPPLLETPLEVFDEGVFTPNDRFFVRWHWANIPSFVDVDGFRLTIRGAVRQPLSLSVGELLRMPRTELAAVNQCSGNSRGFFEPRVQGAQWGHGAMGNAKWLGVSLRHVLDLAGLSAGATAVRFGALDRATDPSLNFDKSIDIDLARNDEVMIAFGMNGEQLPLLNGFPLRLVVPGWYSTYWVKMLSDIEVLDTTDDHYWTAKAYRIPDTPTAAVAPGASGFPTVPINRMVPRSWITSLAEGQTLPFTSTIPVGGIAMGGDSGVARVEASSDGGQQWHLAALGEDYGKYSFRRWDAQLPLERPGPTRLMVRCTNTAGVIQQLDPIWNPSGYMRGNAEVTNIVATAS